MNYFDDKDTRPDRDSNLGPLSQEASMLLEVYPILVYIYQKAYLPNLKINGAKLL